MSVWDTSGFQIAARVAVIAAALGLWECLSVADVIDAASFPSMTGTANELWMQVQSASLWEAVGETMKGWSIGLLLGCSLAIFTGTVCGLNEVAYLSVIPVVEFFKTIPSIAILPLVIVVWGPTLTMKVFLVAFAVFWPLTIQTIYGVRAVDPMVRDTAKVLGLRGFRKFVAVTLPSAAPFIATGMRLAAAVGLILAVIAELIGGAPGLGLNILVSMNAGPTLLPATYALIVVTGCVGVVVTLSFGTLERRILHWHESQRNLAKTVA